MIVLDTCLLPMRMVTQRMQYTMLNAADRPLRHAMKQAQQKVLHVFYWCEGHSVGRQLLLCTAMIGAD
jgi:hypothetical protein